MDQGQRIAQSKGLFIHCLKMRRLAMKAPVSKVANKEKGIDSNLPEAKTKEMVKVLKNLNVAKKLLLFYLVRMRWYTGCTQYTWC